MVMKQEELIPAEPETELKGEIERVIFHNEENGFTVAKVDVQSKRDLVSVVGEMCKPTPGQPVTLRGRWHMDPKWGLQFKASYCAANRPTTSTGIMNFLIDQAKGIGEVYAKRIVETFGEETIDILDQEMERLLEVPGINQKLVDSIAEAWEEHQNIRPMLLFLQSHDISTAYATKIINFYGSQAVDVVNENPYRLATDITGIGFPTADAIAGKLGFPKDSDLRVEAGVIYVLNEMAGQGNVYYPRDPLVDRCCEILEVERSLAEHAIDMLHKGGRVILEDVGGKSGQGVYLLYMHFAEKGIADYMRKLLQAPKTVRAIEAEKAIGWVQGKLGITLAKKQAEAVRAAARNKVLVITGGPGTGKTTIINAVIRIYQDLQAGVLLAAPTGRAAKRMSEATGVEARTIHRLLEFRPQQGGFARNENNPLKGSLLIIDEASMIDTVLMFNLLKAVQPGTTLILVGDTNQLPSVGPGNVLRDVIDSDLVEVIELNEIFRQAQESSIIVNAHAINAGRIPYLESSKDRLTDFYFIRQEELEKVREMIIDLVQNHIPRRFGLDSMDDVQVLTPMHKGPVGAESLNAHLQQALNPETEGISRGDRKFFLHDKVMQIRNNYEKDVYNGDIGRIVAIDREDRSIQVRFDGRGVIFDYGELDQITPAYAVSIHKSQGSEYPAVVVPVVTQHYVLLQRNLIYTAVTRGQKLVVLVGTKQALAMAVRNVSTRKRYTYLAERLAEPEAPKMDL